MILERLIEKFLSFPGIGPRQAKRFAYFLAKSNDLFRRELSRLILEVKNEVRECSSCFGFYESEHGGENLCSICARGGRDHGAIMVVEKDTDLETIESSGVYQGIYFVLGGTLTITRGKRDSSEDVKARLRELFRKIGKEGKDIREIILGTSLTTQGEYTAKFIEEKVAAPLIVKKYPHIKVTRLGRGLSTGTELEYSDRETILHALEGRK
ncbi:MAG TPA: toprim domain-containing protein [Candidatus Paceibacterota bacterium]